MFQPLPLFIGLRYSLASGGSQLVSFLSRVSMLGLILGVALLVLVLSVMNGFDRELRTRILAMVPQASILQAGPMQDWQTVVDMAMARPEILAAAPYIELQGMLVKADRAQGVQLYAVDPVAEAKISAVPEYITEGHFIDLADNVDGIVISHMLAQKLKTKIGNSVALVLPAPVRSTPNLSRLKVVAIFRTDTELDNGLAYIHLHKGQALGGFGDAVEAVQIKVTDLMASGSSARSLVSQLPAGYYYRDWRLSHGNLFEAIQLSKRLVSILLLIIIAVAAFNVVTALIMVVTDKRGDVAILQTLGLAPRRIMGVFLIQGLVIAIIGTVLGVLLGLFLALVATDAVAGIEHLLGYQFLKSDVYPVTYLPTDIRMGDIVAISMTAIGLSVLAALYPAWQATRILPADALRYDK
ncbi:MAG: lipoprotein-releasing ABC transporter permease subunit [Pseudomonadales bacterium]